MITVCILLKNGARTLPATLDSIRSFNEVIVLDNGSTDESKKIATSYPNVRWMESSFIGFGPLRNVASALASNDWILALDADEVVSPDLLKEINALRKDPQSVYSIPRDNYYNGKHIKGCGWHPDRVLRLYNRKETRYCDSQVHESVIAQTIKSLHSPILHTPFQTTTDFLAKIQHYSTLFAKQHAGKKKSSPIKAFFHSLFAFFRSYLLRRGWSLGAEGFIISLYNANSVYYKYLKLYEENSFIYLKNKTN